MFLKFCCSLVVQFFKSTENPFYILIKITSRELKKRGEMPKPEDCGENLWVRNAMLKLGGIHVEQLDQVCNGRSIESFCFRGK